MAKHRATNIQTAVNKSKSATKNRSGSQNLFDRMRSYLEKVNTNDSEVGTNGKFYAYVLYTNKLTVDQFQELFKNNEEFKTDVIIDGSKSTKTKSSGEVVEMYVFVPQITDFLPEPDISLLNKFINLKKDDVVQELLEKQREEFEALGRLQETEQGPTESAPSPQLGPPLSSPASAAVRNRVKRNKEGQRIYKKLRETLNIISMYPKVYRYTENSEYFAPGTACEVEFPNDVQKSMLTMGYGIYKKELAGQIIFESSDAGALDKFVEEESLA